MAAKRNRYKPLPYWASAKMDCREERFIQIGNSLLFADAVKGLSTGAYKLYTCTMMEAGGKEYFKFPLSAAQKYGFAKTSFDRYIKELQEKGFILCVENNRNLRGANLYRFSGTWRQPQTGIAQTR